MLFIKQYLNNIKEEKMKFLYKILDPDVVGKAAYDKFPKFKCAQSAFEAIIEALSDFEKYKNVPSSIYSYGKAGIYAWDGTCGAINGTLGAVSLILDGKDEILKPTVDKILNKLYSEELPFNFDKKIKLPNLTCGGIVFRFLKKYGGDLNSKDRIEFCKNLTYSVVKTAIEVLNELYMKG